MLVKIPGSMALTRALLFAYILSSKGGSSFRFQASVTATPGGISLKNDFESLNATSADAVSTQTSLVDHNETQIVASKMAETSLVYHNETQIAASKVAEKTKGFYLADSRFLREAGDWKASEGIRFRSAPSYEGARLDVVLKWDNQIEGEYCGNGWIRFSHGSAFYYLPMYLSANKRSQPVQVLFPVGQQAPLMDTRHAPRDEPSPRDRRKMPRVPVGQGVVAVILAKLRDHEHIGELKDRLEEWYSIQQELEDPEGNLSEQRRTVLQSKLEKTQDRFRRSGIDDRMKKLYYALTWYGIKRVLDHPKVELLDPQRQVLLDKLQSSEDRLKQCGGNLDALRADYMANRLTWMDPVTS